MHDTKKEYLGFTAYQWLVITAAWVGWGFDVFDALLFNYVSRLCIPSLLGHDQAEPQAITRWTGITTSVLLVGWGLGGIIFGRITDRIGRSRTLLVTMLTYALATAACATAVNLWALLVFRFIASLGIGGEWAAGASLVSETVPEKKRVQAGAILYTAAPAGLFLATFITDLFTRRLDYFAQDSDLAWRVIFLTGLIPAAFAVVIRLKIKEPEVWKESRGTIAPSLRLLFTPELRGKTFSGLILASVALLAWWSSNAFLPAIASFLVYELKNIPPASELSTLKASFVTIATTCFNLGGLIGTLLTVPIALRFGRKPMFFIYFLLSAGFLWGGLRLPLDPHWRLYAMFFSGLTVFGVFGSFTFYLPELFPVHLRGTGSGFCYNIGRFITAAGPFIVGWVAQAAAGPGDILRIVSWVAVIPLIGALFSLTPLVKETRIVYTVR